MAWPRALLFDLDGTLVDGEPAVAESVAYACEVVAHTVSGLTPSQVLAANGQAFAALWPGVEEDWTLGRLSGEAFSKQVWRRTLQACGRQDEALVTLAYSAMLRRTLDTLRLFDDVPDLMLALRDKYRLSVITNGASDTQAPKLVLDGISGCFDVTAVSGAIGLAKPDERIFRFVLDKLGVPAEAAWHIGDSPSKDIAGARAAGVTSVWINRNERVLRPHEAQPDYAIESLSELPALLDAVT